MGSWATLLEDDDKTQKVGGLCFVCMQMDSMWVQNNSYSVQLLWMVVDIQILVGCFLRITGSGFGYSHFS